MVCLEDVRTSMHCSGRLDRESCDPRLPARNALRLWRQRHWFLIAVVASALRARSLGVRATVA